VTNIMPFCGECGAKLEAKELFCSKCGAKVSSAKATPAGPDSATVRPMIGGTGGLFDQSRQYYVLKEKWFDWGGGDIMDERGNKIGKMHRKVLAIRNTTELQELNGQISATINRKMIAIKPTHDIHEGDADGPLIGRLEKTLLSMFRPKFELKDAGGNIILTAQGKFMGWDFNIFRGQDEKEVIAEIRKADRWRDVFLGGIMDFSDTYAVKILDPSLDRRTALGFVIAIDNVLHDQKN
jgi:uncharacterized protein YxjI